MVKWAETAQGNRYPAHQKIMGYHVTITRAPKREDEEGQPIKGLPKITKAEWFESLKKDPTLILRNDVSEGCIQWTGISSANREQTESTSDEGAAFLFWSDGEIYSKNPSEPLIGKMVEIAALLNAQVFGDEGEEYFAEGEIRGPTENGQDPRISAESRGDCSVADPKRGLKVCSTKKMELFVEKLHFFYEGDNGDVSLDRLAFDPDRSIYELEVTFTPDHSSKSKVTESSWLVRAEGLKVHRVSRDAKEQHVGGKVYFGSDHTLLKPYAEAQAELVISGSGIHDSFPVLSKLMDSYPAIMGQWISMDPFLSKDFRSILRRGNGSLASGPITLMQEWKKVVSHFGFITDLNVTKKKVDSSPSALVFGVCFIVADKFGAAQLK